MLKKAKTGKGLKGSEVIRSEGSVKKVKLEQGVLKSLVAKDGKLSQTTLRKLFRSCDQDKNGTLDKEEAKAFFASLYDLVYDKTPISQRPELNFMLETWFTLFDADKNGTIEWEEFIVEMEKLVIPEKAETLFGRPISEVSCDLSGGFIPNIMFLCLKYIFEKGLSEEGILRLCGSSTVVQMMQKEADIARKFTLEMLESRQSILEFHHCVSSFMKLYIRSLPSSIIQEEVFKALQANQKNLEVEFLKEQLQLLETIERNLIYSISLLCQHIIKRKEMSTQACGVCWGGSVCTSYCAQTLEGTCFAAQLMEFIIIHHDTLFDVNDFKDIYSMSLPSVNRQYEAISDFLEISRSSSTGEVKVFTVNFDFGHKKVPLVATETLGNVLQKICEARGIQDEDYAAVDVDGNPLSPSTRLSDIKGAEMKYKLKDAEKLRSMLAPERPSRPVRPKLPDNLKLLPPKYQLTLAHSNVDIERANNDESYREILLSVLTCVEEEGIELDESGIQSLDPNLNSDFDNMLEALAVTKEVEMDLKQLSDESKKVILELFKKG